jgi:branched-chain amino acid transport system ATP-binding protein
MNEDILLSAKNLSVRFGGVLAVNNVSFDVKRGEVFTLIGPYGAGKTTVFNLISRIYTPTTGTIDYAGPNGVLRLTEQAPHQIARLGIARTFQNIELFEHATVLQNLLIGRHTHRKTGLWSELFFTGKTRAAEIEAREKVEQVIDLLDLQHHRESMVAGLPYGVRKVVELARALCTEPKLLLLDEPSSGLNVEETEDMAFWITDIKEELGITVLMVEHDMSLVSKVSDRVLAMSMGTELASGTPAQVQADPGVIEAYLRHPRAQAAQRRERLRPDQGDPRREPAGAPQRDRHRAGLQRRGQDHHPQDHQRHHRPAQGFDRVQGREHHRAGPGPHRAAGPEPRA